MLIPIGLIIAAYFLGAVPFGLLVSKARGVDIRKVGSGNIGATNVFRSVGKSWGLLTLLLDALKGFLPAHLFPLAAAHMMTVPSPVWLPLACGCAAVVGLNWPVYIGFKGGKGIATTAGALLGFAPAPLGIGVLTFAVVFGLSRYVSLG
jgi:glycerol-3-phosphate acyltransferase PlsY